MKGYDKVATGSSGTTLSRSASLVRALMWCVICLWAVPPMVYVLAYALRSSSTSTVIAVDRSSSSTTKTGTKDASISVVASTASAAVVVSQKSCEQLRMQHGSGSWEPVGGGALKVCSELKRLPGSGGCPSPKVWIAASKLCIKLGARLCSNDELLAGAGRVLDCPSEPTHGSEGGKHTTTTVWSSSHCGIGGSNYLVQRSSGKPGVELSSPNASRPFAAGIANCDISSGRHQGVCCADQKATR